MLYIERVVCMSDEKKRKIYRLFRGEMRRFIIFFALLIIVWGGYFILRNVINQKKELERLVPDDYSFVFQVDKVGQDANDYIVSGFAFRLNEDSSEDKVEIFLHDIEKNKIIHPKKCEYTIREDVNEYFLCDYDYSRSGFEVSFKSGDIKLDNKNYEVLLFDKNNERIYQTGTYITGNGLMYTDAKSFEAPNVVGTDLERVVEQGMLRAYVPDSGIYVYQYEDSLYWIATSDYQFEEDGSTVIQYQINTTQVQKLPQFRLDNNWLWDNISFVFEEHELHDVKLSGLRVAKVKLPEQYSITKIWTGYVVEDWIWRKEFRPWYDFRSE